MGAEYVLGANPLPIISFFARVGGPLASARAEEASLLQLLRDVRQRYSNQVHLLIFVDCLVVLDIIRKWGRSDFHPSHIPVHTSTYCLILTGDYVYWYIPVYDSDR